MWADGHLRWRGLIPTYRGRPGAIGARVTSSTVSIRVERGGAAANFDLDRTSGVKRASGALTSEQAEAAFPPTTGQLPVAYDATRRQLSTAGAARVLPATALAPQPYHADGGVLWIVTPGELTALSLATLSPVAVIR
jgi:hypothetical protein